jgi:carotenoid 1,2-hydratase
VPGGGERACGPRFDRPVPRRGYEWWYVDALSDDGRHGLTIIAFIGSVFSPWYAAARRGAGGDPENFCCMHLALYGRGGSRWAMTERGRRSLQRGADFLTIGPSSMHWDGNALTVTLVERCAPVPRRVRGVVRLIPAALPDRAVSLDGADHDWAPIAPVARVEARFEQPGLSWNGPAYFDTNRGASPLEEAFDRWDWSRAPGRDGTIVLYNGHLRDGREFSTALHYGADGSVADIEPPPRVALPRTFWRMPRFTRVDAGMTASVQETLTDAPFYARSVIRTHLLGEARTAMHESLSMDRFTAPWVQAMLPFKAPRAL